jgi:alkylation response protein AidB-like acyl-CoA dehydrogenase
MDFALSDEQRALRDTVLRFAERELNADVIERDRAQTFRRDLWQQCAAIGLQGLPVPEEHGGAALDTVSTAIALEAFGNGCRDGGLVFSLCAHLLACVVPVWKHGSDAQKDRYLRGLCDGTLVGAHAITEPGSGSDTFSMRTRAERVGGQWRINGTKTFVSNAPVADVAVVFAVTDPDKGFTGGITAFLLDRSIHGFATGQKFEKMGLRTSPVGEVVLDNVVAGDDAVLGSVGGGAAVFGTAMDGERTLLVATHVGEIERLLTTTIEYTRTRSQFGQKIAKFQALGHAVADMKVQLEAARLLVYRAAWRLGQSRGVTLDASIAKLFVSETLVATALKVVQVHGGYGFMVEYEVERALRDAIGSTIYSGTSEMQRNIIARWLGML